MPTTKPKAQQAIKLMAEKSGKPEEHFRVVESVTPGIWYDWADVETGKVGQCRMGENWAWVQDPRGERPVILAYSEPEPKAS